MVIFCSRNRGIMQLSRYFRISLATMTSSTEMSAMLKKRITLASLGEKEWLVLLLWFGLSILGTAKEILDGNINNYLVFKHVFLHVCEQKPLYIPYPAEYLDVNLYGPIFSFIIAPFAWLPDKAGAMLWVIANAAFLFVAIRQLPLTRIQQNLILLFSSNELLGASSYLQFNQAIAACIILSFALILKGRNCWAAFFIVLGTLTKIYGIVGLAFFFFSDNRWRFIGSLLLWGLVLFLLPMLLSSPTYIIHSYKEWMEALSFKNEKNVHFEQGVLLQDISALGFIRRVFKLQHLNNLVVIIPAILLFLSQYLMLHWRHNSKFRLLLLCSTLLFPVLFSTSSESPTYIIAFPAICIWYMIQPATKWNNALFIFALVVCSFSHSDVFTPWVRHHIAVPYALKAFPCLLIWLIIIYQILTKKFLPPVSTHVAADTSALNT